MKPSPTTSSAPSAPPPADLVAGAPPAGVELAPALGSGAMFGFGQNFAALDRAPD